MTKWCFGYVILLDVLIVYAYMQITMTFETYWYDISHCDNVKNYFCKYPIDIINSASV